MSCALCRFLRAWLSTAGVLGLLSLLLTPHVFASGVITNSSFSNLQSAVQAGGSVTFTADAAITVGQTLLINTNTVIDALGHTVTLNGNQSVRLFNVSTGATLALYGLTLAYGADNGTNGSAGANGQDSDMYDGGDGGRGANGESAAGGAIYNEGIVFASSCSFMTNTATGGNGGAGGNGGNGALAGGNGGPGGNGGKVTGAAICNMGVLTVTNCFFTDSQAAAGNGGAGGTNGVGVFVSHSGPGGGGALAWGGAIFNAGTGAVYNSTFVYSVATAGNTTKAGASLDSTVGDDGSDGGEARGGSIYNTGTLILVNSTLGDSDANGGNGGDGGNGTWTAGSGGDGGSAFGGNLCNIGTAYVTNVTIVGGGATGGASGLAGTGPAAGVDGDYGASHGWNLVNLSSLKVINTIIAYPFTNTPAPENAYGAVTDLGHNLSSAGTPPLSGPGSLQRTDPLLAARGPNGGFAPTYALLSNSPAIDAGDNSVKLTIDQRGAPRPEGPGIDIGAFEYGQYLHQLSGHLTEGTTPLSGFSVHAGGLSTMSGADGVFAFTNLLKGTYTVVPPNVGVGFAPTERIITLTDSDVTNADFTANPTQLTVGPLSTNRQFQLTVTGLPGLNYVLEGSSNLVAWTAVVTNATDQAGAFDFTGAAATNAPRRFYRSRPR